MADRLTEVRLRRAVAVILRSVSRAATAVGWLPAEAECASKFCVRAVLIVPVRGDDWRSHALADEGEEPAARRRRKNLTRTR
jgi:hypothetical protein